MLTILLLLLNLSSSLSQSVGSYHLVKLVGNFSSDFDTSHECTDGSCIILTPRTGVFSPPQGFNALCYNDSVTCYGAQCDQISESLLDQQLKFSCYNMDTCEREDCGVFIGDCVVSGDSCDDEGDDDTPPTTDNMSAVFEIEIFECCLQLIDSTTSSSTTSTSPLTTTISPTTTTASPTTTTPPTTTTIIENTPSHDEADNKTNTAGTTFHTEAPVVCNTFSSTFAPTSCVRDLCSPKECYFNDHCYFFRYHQQICEDEITSANSSQLLCQAGELSSKGVAVETTGENYFVLSLIHAIKTNDAVTILTSGIYSEDGVVWSGWNSSVDPAVIAPWKDDYSSNGSAILYLQKNWNQTIINWHTSPDIFHGNYRVYSLCERESNWSIADLQLRARCVEEYDRLDCQSGYCCAVDRGGQFWFSCSDVGQPAVQPCPNDPAGNNVTWDCVGGNFATEEPDYSNCECKNACRKMHDNATFQTCSGELAFADCQNGKKGYRKWPCTVQVNGEFVFEGAEPDSLCCATGEPCRAVDSTLNVRIACPSTNISWVSQCPNSSDIYLTRRQCTKSGFVDSEPTVTSCCSSKCSVYDDERGIIWSACSGGFATNSCPSNMSGLSTWYCGQDQHFIGAPDDSQCQPIWLDEIRQMLKNGTKAVTVLQKIDEHMQTDLSGVGLEYILNQTKSCAELFLLQNPGNGSASDFTTFMAAHTQVLNDVTDSKFKWKAITDLKRREELVSLTINMTEYISFSLRKVVNNATFPFTFEKAGNAVGLNVTYTDTPEVAEMAGNNCTVKIAALPADNHSVYAATAMFFSHKTGSTLFPLLDSSDKTMNSAVLSLTVADVTGGDIAPARGVRMRVTFQHAAKGREPPSTVINRRLHDGELPSPVIGNSTCFYFNTLASPSQWVDSGCKLISSTAEQTTCECEHLSSFAVLVGVHEYQPDPVLEVLSIVCSCLSIVSLVATLVTLVLCRDTNDGRSRMGKDLCVCLIIAHIIFVTAVDKKNFNISEGVCTFVGIFLHYFLMSAFFWMLLEAYRLYQLVVVVFTREQDLRFAISTAIGYGLPAVIVIVTEAVGAFSDDQPYGRDELCWLQLDYIWGFDGPVFLIIVINLGVIIISMKAAVSAKLRQEILSMDSLRIWVKGLLSLSVLLGVTWLVGLAYMDNSIVLAYLFVILNGLQGVFIFLFRCVLNEQVRKIIKTEVSRCVYRWNIFGFSESSLSQSFNGSRKTGSASVSNSSDGKPTTFFKSGSRKSIKKRPLVTYDSIMRKSLQATRSRRSLANEKSDNAGEDEPDQSEYPPQIINAANLPAYHNFTIMEDSESMASFECSHPKNI